MRSFLCSNLRDKMKKLYWILLPKESKIYPGNTFKSYEEAKSIHNMCLDIMVVVPETDTKEGIINVNIVNIHRSLLMLFNIHHQPSQSTCHFWERHITIPGMWMSLNTSKMLFIPLIPTANKLIPWLIHISILTEVLLQGPPKLFCSSAGEIEVRQRLTLCVHCKGLNSIGFIRLFSRDILKITFLYWYQNFDVFYHQLSDSVTHGITFLVRWNLAKKRLK